MSKIPTPQERPDLYDDADCRPDFDRETGIIVPEQIQKMIDERKVQKDQGKK